MRPNLFVRLLFVFALTLLFAAPAAAQRSSA
jgi:hypothetical protein